MNRFLAFAIFVFVAGSAFGQDAAPSPNGQDKPRSWDINLGYSRSYIKDGKSQFYYKVDYKGTPLVNRGQIMTPANIGDKPQMPNVEGTDDDFQLKIQDGIGQLNGPLADALALKPFTALPGLFRDLRGGVEVTGKFLNSQQLNIAFGLETKPLTPLVALNSSTGLGITNFIRLGVFGEKQSNRENGAPPQDSLIGTFRAVVGKGFGYVMSQDQKDRKRKALARAATDATLAKAKDLLENGDLSDDLVQLVWVATLPTTPDAPGTPATHGVQLPTDEATWQRQLKDTADLYFDQQDQPRFSLEFRGEGSYAPVKFDVRRYNSLYSFGLNYWLDPTRPDNGKLSVTYQNGYARGAPLESLDGLIVTLGVKF